MGNTQINLVCGHSTKAWRYMAFHHQLGRHGSELAMEWKDGICQACRRRDFQEGMVRVVEWLARVGPCEAVSVRTESNYVREAGVGEDC